MNEQELIKKCLINEDAIETYPFKEDMKYGKIPILRHKSNNKWFGVIFYLNKILYINLKAEPETISILKEQYPEYARRMADEMPEVIENAYKNAIATLRDIQKGIISLQAENDLLETSSFNPDEYRTNKNLLDKLFGKQRLSEY